MFRRLLWGAALTASATMALAATDYPEGYTKCAKEGETCSFSGTRSVAYGKSGEFVYATLTGPITCSRSLFPSINVPDPRYCSYSNSGSSSSSSSSSGGGGGINLSASAGNAQVFLTWSYSGGVTPGNQEVYVDTDSNPSGRTRIASVSSSTTSYTAGNLSNGTTYWFWIKNQQNGVTTNSNAASATPSGGSSSSSSSSGGTGTITGSSCSGGSTTTVNSTIRVTSGTFDGGCRTYNGGGDLGDGSQDEGQDPIFRVENGATLRNVYIGSNGADGIHVYNGGNVDNVHWSDVGEDALTIKSSGTVNVSNVEGYNSADKFFQINAASTLNVSNCIVDNAGKFLRQNGGTDFRIVVNVDRCQISDMNEGIFRTDSESSEARLTNSRLRNSGDLCIGPWASCTGSNNTTF